MFMSDIINQIELNTDKNPKDEIFDITSNGTSKYRDNTYVDNLVMPIDIYIPSTDAPLEFNINESTATKLVFTDDRINNIKYFTDINNDTGTYEVIDIQKEININTSDLFNDNSAIATYLLDNNSNDISNNYNGTWVNNELYGVGIFNECALFDDKSYISVPTIKLTGDFTISFWAGIELNKQYVRCFSSDSPRCYIYLRDGDKNIFGIRTQLNSTIKTIEYDAKEGINHYAITRYMDNYYFYYNNELIGVVNNTTDFSDFYINILNDDAGDMSWNISSLDQVRILNRYVNKDEINILYNENTLGLFKYIAYIDREYIINNILVNTTNISDIFRDNSDIALYTLDDKVNDINNIFNSEWNGTPMYVDGKYGKAAKFDGTNYIILGDFINNNKIKSISFWFTYTNNYEVLISTSDELCYIQIAGGGSKLYIRTPNSDRSNYVGKYIEDLDLEPGNMYFLHITNDYGVLTLYIDNVKKGSFSAYSFGDLYSLRLAYTSKSEEKLIGIIDQVRLLNRVPSDIERDILYNESKYEINNLIAPVDNIPTDENFGLDNSIVNLSSDIPQETNTIRLFTLTNNQLSVSNITNKYIDIPIATSVNNTDMPNVIEIKALTSSIPQNSLQDVVIEDVYTNIKTSLQVTKDTNNYIIPTGSTITVEEYEDFIKYNGNDVEYKFYREMINDEYTYTDKIIDISNDILNIPSFMLKMDNIFKLKITNLGSATLINNNLVKVNRIDNFLHDATNDIFYINFNDIMNNTKLHFIKTEKDKISFTVEIVSDIIDDINYKLVFYV